MYFEKNDIVRLREEYFDGVKPELFFSQNIFFLDNYSEDKNTAFLRNVSIPIPSDEVCPVRIDGIEDRDVYYDPVVAADVVRPGESLPNHHVNKNGYYLQEMRKCFDSDGRPYYDVIKDAGYVYVHELQHQRPDISRDLRINYKVSPFIKPFPQKVKLGTIATMMTYKKYVETEHEWDGHVKVYVEKKVSYSKMVATSVPSNGTAYVILFKESERFEARYAEFYINSSIGKLFLLDEQKVGKLEGKATIAKLRQLVIRWVDVYKECSIYLESMIQAIQVYESRFRKTTPTLTGLLSFLFQVRDAMVMEMMMPDLFEKANFSVLKKWKQDTDSIMSEFYQTEDSSNKQVVLIGRLLEAIGSANGGIVNEMAKYRVYMLEFLRFAERNKDQL